MYGDIAKYQLCVFIYYMFIPNTLMELQTKIINRNSMINAVVGIINSCRVNDESSVLVAGEFHTNEIYELTSSEKSVITMNRFNLSNYEHVQNTIQALVISPNSNDDLNVLLDQVKNSSMWNYLRYTIILSKIVTNNSCDEASSYLFTAWKGDLLNSIFMCTMAENNIRVYTYNPYTDLAPKPWSFVTKFKDNADYWYLYSITHDEGHETCKTFFFDKTLRLDGYKGIKAVTYIPKKRNTTNVLFDYGINVKKRFDVVITRIWRYKLNITYVPTHNSHYGAFDEKGNPHGIDKHLTNGHYDILMDHRFLGYTKGLAQSTSTLGETGISFLIEYRGHVSILIRIASYFKPIVILFTTIILGVTIAVLKLSIEESYDTAAIEVFRLFLNGPLLRAPINASPRIYLFTVLIFVFIVQSILQSKILSFIMVPMDDDLDTFAELEDHQEYTIYCKPGYLHFLPSGIAKRTIIKYSFAELFNKTKNVFIWENIINISMARTRKLHVSRQIIARHHMIYRTRRSWPLFRRINDLSMRIFESGISYHQNKIATFQITKNHRSNHEHHNSSPIALGLQHVGFAFRILLFGFSSSLFSFMIEIKAWNFFPMLWRNIKIFHKYYRSL